MDHRADPINPVALLGVRRVWFLAARYWKVRVRWCTACCDMPTQNENAVFHYIWENPDVDVFLRSGAQPVDLCAPLSREPGVGLLEMAATQKGAGRAPCRQGRRVVGTQDQVRATGGFDAGLLALGVVAPQHEYLGPLRGGNRVDEGVGNGFPALAGVRTGLSVFDRERGVQQQHPLPGPG